MGDERAGNVDCLELLYNEVKQYQASQDVFGASAGLLSSDL
jgi:hypothetical protein